MFTIQKQYNRATTTYWYKHIKHKTVQCRCTVTSANKNLKISCKLSIEQAKQKCNLEISLRKVFSQEFHQWIISGGVFNTFPIFQYDFIKNVFIVEKLIKIWLTNVQTSKPFIKHIIFSEFTWYKSICIIFSLSVNTFLATAVLWRTMKITTAHRLYCPYLDLFDIFFFFCFLEMSLTALNKETAKICTCCWSKHLSMNTKLLYLYHNIIHISFISI